MRKLAAAVLCTLALAAAGCGPTLTTPTADRQAVVQEEALQEELARSKLKPWSDRMVIFTPEQIAWTQVLTPYYILCKAAEGLPQARDFERYGGLGFWVTPRVPYNMPEYAPLVQAGYLTSSVPEGVVVKVVPGSAADRAGLKEGDIIAEINGRRFLGRGVLYGSLIAQTVPQAELQDPKWKSMDAVLLRAESAMDATLRLKVLRVDEGQPRELEITMQPEPLIAFPLKMSDADVINAWTDGKAIYVTKGIIEWSYGLDTTYLTAVLGHELSHVLLGHVQKSTLRSTLGGILGLTLDIAIAGMGVDTGGFFTRLGAGVGALTFSKQEEREADYLMMYLLARGGLDYRKAPEVFRELAAVSPENIKGGYMDTHPGTAERYVYLQETIEEIDQRIASGEDPGQLVPRQREDHEKADEPAEGQEGQEPTA